MHSERMQKDSFFWWGLLFEGGLGILAWALAWIFGQPLWDMLRWNVRDILIGIAVSVPMLLGFLVCVHWPVGPLERIQRFSDEFLIPLFSPCNLFELALISLAAGVGEELLFRGLLQGLFSQWFGVWVGVILAGVVFGLMHFITPTYAVLASLIGFYLGGVYLWDGNLLSVIVAHALYDFLALVYLLRGPTRSDVDRNVPIEHG